MMATQTIDARGLKCPQPTLKMTIALNQLKKGDTMDVLADCDTFEKDLQGWASRTRRTVLWVKKENGHYHCQVQV